MCVIAGSLPALLAVLNGWLRCWSHVKRSTSWDGCPQTPQAAHGTLPLGAKRSKSVFWTGAVEEVQASDSSSEEEDEEPSRWARLGASAVNKGPALAGPLWQRNRSTLNRSLALGGTCCARLLMPPADHLPPCLTAAPPPPPPHTHSSEYSDSDEDSEGPRRRKSGGAGRGGGGRPAAPSNQGQRPGAQHSYNGVSEWVAPVASCRRGCMLRQWVCVRQACSCAIMRV